jgi:transcriptional regulator with XRE-family HTH domain
MAMTQSIGERMKALGMSFEQLLAASGLERKILEAIYYGRYTPSPEQRRRVAEALGVPIEQIGWGHTNEVIHIYGHGPQFGRSP